MLVEETIWSNSNIINDILTSLQTIQNSDVKRSISKRYAGSLTFSLFLKHLKNNQIQLYIISKVQSLTFLIKKFLKFILLLNDLH